ncbi:MAG: DUF349 domain-containing protein [Xanthomonadales bacterium]|nr:DUF349 domain-containing protein [Xanthomonadales bacterium]
MNWKQHIFKPDWQHRSAERRVHAVTHSNDAEMMQALPRIMVEDEELSVRMAAARRVLDLEALDRARQASEDESFRQFLQQRCEDLVCKTHSDRPSVAQRRAYIEASGQRHFLERVACEAAETELRMLALSRIDRQGFLGDRAIHDPDPNIRRKAAAAISRHATLKRVIDETRTRDKAMHAALLKRLKGELLDAGDPQTVGEEALDICKQLEAHAVMHQHESATVPENFALRWQRIAEHVSKELGMRHARAVQRIEAQAEQEAAEPDAHDSGGDPDTPAAEEAPVEPADPEAGLNDPRVAEFRASLEQLSSLDDSQLRRDRLAAVNKQLASLPSESRAEFEKAIKALDQRFQKFSEQTEAQISKAATLFEQYRKELEDGALHKALELRQQIRSMAGSLKNDKRWKSLNQQMTGLHGRLKELRDWQHWSNDKVRKDLVKQMELLPRADLHPDALLSRIHTLQERWKELERSEQIPGDPHFAAAPWIWRKFQAAGNAAFEAAKPFLDKRSEIQEKRVQSALDLAGKLRELAAVEQPDWVELRKGMNGARAQLRELDALPHKSRKKAANALRKALSSANERMQQHYEVIEKEKRKLIRIAEQLVHVEDRKEAIDQAKRLQADWKRAGALWRGRENALWKEFRKPLDPLFEGLAEEQQARKQEFKARLDQQNELVREMAALLESDDSSLEEHQGRVQGLTDQWKDIERPDRKTRARFDDQLEDYGRRLKAHQAQLEQQQRQRWWDKAALLHELESALLEGIADAKTREQLKKRWPREQAPSELDEILDQRFKKALGAEQAAEYDEQSSYAARMLCIQLEFLSGVPSPESDREARMKYQVERLSQSMTGELERQSAVQEALRAEREWLTLGVLKPAEYDQYRQRIRAALDQILEINDD